MKFKIIKDRVRDHAPADKGPHSRKSQGHAFADFSFGSKNFIIKKYCYFGFLVT